MSAFLEMNGYGAYVWSAYAIAIGGLVLNVWMARRQLRLAREEARRQEWQDSKWQKGSAGKEKGRLQDRLKVRRFRKEDFREQARGEEVC